MSRWRRLLIQCPNFSGKQRLGRANPGLCRLQLCRALLQAPLVGTKATAFANPSEVYHVHLITPHARSPFSFPQVLEIGGSQGQEEGEDRIFNDVLVAPTKPSWVGNGSPAGGNTEGQAVDLGMTLVTEGILRTKCDQDLASLIEEYPLPDHGRVFRRPAGSIMALPSDGEDLPVVPQSWLYGHPTLQQTGQSIGAELEVAMLCMQKRLAKVKTISRMCNILLYTMHLHRARNAKFDYVKIDCSNPTSHTPPAPPPPHP